MADESKPWFTVQIVGHDGQWRYQESTQNPDRAHARAEQFRRGSKATGSPVLARVVAGKNAGGGRAAAGQVAAGGGETKREVLALVHRHQREVEALSAGEVSAMLPVFKAAQRELRKRMRGWMARHPDGELRWTIQSYRAALLQIEHGTRVLEARLDSALDETMGEAFKLADLHLVAQVAARSKRFGMPRLVLPGPAARMATAQSYKVAQIRTSTARYAWGRGRASVAADMQRMLAVDLLQGAPVHQTIQRLVEHGGPRGLVALKGVAGEEGAVCELIPEGLFRRYRFWAERIVRTETTAAYGFEGREAMREAAQIVPGLKRQWFANTGACVAICQPMAGQIVGVDEPFYTPFGDPVRFGGAHPLCGCSAVPYVPSAR